MTPLIRLSWVLIVALIFGVGPAAAQSPDAKLDQQLRRVRSGGPQRVIIRTRPGSRAAVRKALKAHGDKIAADHPAIDAVTAEVHGDDLRKLAARSDVESIAVDAEVSTTARPSRKKQGFTSKTVSTVTSATLRATLGYWGDFLYGAGVGVAVVDSGIAPLPAFGTRITAFYDFTDGAFLQTPPHDEYGHGTHVAGLIAANDPNYMGVASQSRLIGLKVLDGNGKGRTSDVIRALEFAVANRVALGIDIINLSLGHAVLSPVADDPLVQAVEAAVRAGIVVVVSAGNFGTNPETGEIGYAGVTSPGNAPSAITVGAADTKGTATRVDDEVTRYSSRGPTWYDAFAKPDVAAPGHSLVSLGAVESYLFKKYPSLTQRNGGRRYLKLSGTSMATGVASGVVATMIEANRWGNVGSTARLTPNAVKAMLQYSAVSVRATGLTTAADALTQGTGEINADGAARLAYFADVDAPAGAVWSDRTTPYLQPQSNFGGQTFDWAKNIIWGESILWGDTVFANEPAWATAIVWGDAVFTGVAWSVYVQWFDNIVWSMADDNIVWGENIVWGDGLLRASYDDNIVWGELMDGDDIVWGNLLDDNIVWGNLDDNIVWGAQTVVGGLK